MTERKARGCPSTRPRFGPGAGAWGVTGLVLLSLLLALLLGGCGGTPTQPAPAHRGPPDAVPKVEPKSRYGNMDSYVVFGRTYYPKDSSRNHVERGIASWYGTKFHGRKTSSGEPYDMYQMTAAHKTLPLPTYALVRNLENGRSAVVKINDRGPFVGDRIIDLSYAAAKKIGMDKQGTALVEVVSIDPRDHGGKVPKRRLDAAMRGRLAAAERGTGARAAGDSGARSTGAPPPARSAPAATPTEPAQRPAATPAVASSATGSVYLQVGAFGTRGNAEQLRRRLVGLLSDPVEVLDAGSNGVGLYKVKVGPIASRADADALSQELLALGMGRPILVDD